MPKNKQKYQKQQVQNKIQSSVIDQMNRKENTVKSLVCDLNHLMAQSLEAGIINLNDPQTTADLLVKEKAKQIFQQIVNGYFQVRQTQIPFKIFSKKPFKHQNEIQSFQQHINNELIIQPISESHISTINQQLRQFHQNMKKEKQIQKNYFKKLQLKAKEFIGKVHKEKQQFEEQLKNKKTKSRVFLRAYSEETIQIMKDRLAQRLQEKKLNLAQKLKSIQQRKVTRLQNSVKNQISYWNKVKQYQSCKNLNSKDEKQSESLFPQIGKSRLITANKSMNESRITISSRNILRSDNQGLVLYQKNQQIDEHIMKTKLKLQNFQSITNKKQTKSLIKASGEDNFDDLFISNRSHISGLSMNPQLQNHRLKSIDKFKLKIGHDKPKFEDVQPLNNIISHNQKKKQKKQSGFSQPLKNSSRSIVSENLSINALNYNLGKNPIESSLEQIWKSTLNKIKFHQVDKVKGLTELTQIEKKINKFDTKGIIERLKLKAEVISSMEKDQEKTNYLKQEVNRQNFVASNILEIEQKKRMNPDYRQGPSSKPAILNNKLNISQNEFISDRFGDRNLHKK